MQKEVFMKRLNKAFVTGTAFALTMASAFALTACHEMEPTVYGPAQIETEYSTEEDYAAALYGPPEYFEEETVLPEEETFDVEQEFQEDVYGPPADFGF